MTTRKDLGNLGEEKAAKYLKNKGFLIISRNYWKPFGEVDIIAQAPDGTLVFVEIKTTSANSPFSSEDQMTKSKIKKSIAIAQYCSNLEEFKKYISPKRGWRIDSICLTVSGKDVSFSHYENIGL
jgi:Holliday junction resolvase-like predicted endonuclease